MRCPNREPWQPGAWRVWQCKKPPRAPAAGILPALPHGTATPAPCPSCSAQPHRLQRGFAWTSKACRHARGLSLISPLGFTREDGSSCSTAAIYSFTLKATFLAESKALAVNLWAFKLDLFDEGTVAVSPLLSRPSRGLAAGGQQGTESRQWAGAPVDPVSL